MQDVTSRYSIGWIRKLFYSRTRTLFIDYEVILGRNAVSDCNLSRMFPHYQRRRKLIRDQSLCKHILSSYRLSSPELQFPGTKGNIDSIMKIFRKMDDLSALLSSFMTLTSSELAYVYWPFSVGNRRIRSTRCWKSCSIGEKWSLAPPIHG